MSRARRETPAARTQTHRAMTNAEIYLKSARERAENGELSMDDRYFVEDLQAAYEEEGKKALKNLSSRDFKRLRELS